MDWPASSGLRSPRIPAAAVERTTATDKAGAKLGSEFWHRGKRVGVASWGADGGLHTVEWLRGGVRVGYRIERSFDDTDRISYLEPLRNGRVHGWAKQFDKRGRVVMVCPFKDGTGVDYWCDERGRLSEEHPSVRRLPSGVERWWEPNQKRIWSETH